MTHNSAQKGFTLVELLVVISIIGILAAILLTNFSGSRLRARDAARKQDLNQIKTALRIYYNDYQRYPDSSAGNEIQGCGAAGTSTCPWGGSFQAGTNNTVYMGFLPFDPVNNSPYVYQYTLDPLSVGDTDLFWIETQLENKSDEDSAKSQLRCDPAVTTLTDPDIVPQRYLVCQD